MLVMPWCELLPRLERVLEGGFERLGLVHCQEGNGVPITFTVRPIIVLTFSTVRGHYPVAVVEVSFAIEHADMPPTDFILHFTFVGAVP